jgi:hypothetical protein
MLGKKIIKHSETEQKMKNNNDGLIPKTSKRTSEKVNIKNNKNGI